MKKLEPLKAKSFKKESLNTRSLTMIHGGNLAEYTMTGCVDSAGGVSDCSDKDD